VDKIKTAGVEAMAEITGMNLPAAQAVYNFFASRNEI
jgi:excinuclease ABC subunit C